MNHNPEAVNQEALEALGMNELYQAQTLFRINAQRAPCLMTFNNLGVFHVFEGLLKPDNSGRAAKKLGLHYLEKAELYQVSYLTLLAFGHVCFEDADYGEASEYFGRACELKLDYATAYNLGISLYRNGLDHEASVWLERALGICDAADYNDTYAAYAFSLFGVNPPRCRAALDSMLNFRCEGIEVETFVLAYLCNYVRVAEQKIRPMLKHYCLSIQDMVLVLDCLLELGKKAEAEEYLKQEVDVLEESDYNSITEIRHLTKAFKNADYRKEFVDSYRLIRPLIKQCCYYGCKKHNL